MAATTTIDNWLRRNSVNKPGVDRKIDIRRLLENLAIERFIDLAISDCCESLNR